MALTPPFTGRCLCGAVTWRSDAAPLWENHCHCESCRRATGSGATSFVGVADGTWAWTGAPPSVFSSSPGVQRFFCGTCGSPMAYRNAAIPGEMHFHAGTLDDPAAFEPTAHDHADEMLPWMAFSDGLVRT